MDLFPDWLYSVAASSVGAAALIGIVGYLGRSQLSHWLNKDLERLKAGYQRELEAYKVSLIAESERLKASQDVRKAMAVRIAEKRFSAIDELHRKLSGQTTQVLAAISASLSHDQATRKRTLLARVEGLNEASNAATLAEPFLEVAEIAAMHVLIGTLSQALAGLGDVKFFLTEDEIDALNTRLRDLECKCEQILKRYITDMLSMAVGE